MHPIQILSDLLAAIAFVPMRLQVLNIKMRWVYRKNRDAIGLHFPRKFLVYFRPSRYLQTALM